MRKNKTLAMDYDTYQNDLVEERRRAYELAFETCGKLLQDFRSGKSKEVMIKENEEKHWRIDFINQLFNETASNSQK
jgi:hypothetical protein